MAKVDKKRVTEKIVSPLNQLESKQIKEIMLPSGIIERIPHYLRCLTKYKKRNKKTISSEEISAEVGVNAAEIRRDLSYFGTFGKRGVGYNVELLINALTKILDAGHEHRIAVLGAGNLGSAIVGFRGLKEHGFKLSAIFDVKKELIGTDINGFTVLNFKDLGRVVREEKIEIGILAVPTEMAQVAADSLVKAGVEVILNYTSALIIVPKHVFLHTTDPVLELMHTLYYLSRTSALK